MKEQKQSLLTALLTGVFCATAALVIGLNTAEDVPAQEIKDTEITTKPIYCYTEMYTPSGDTSFKSYMGYTKITNTNSAQYKLQGECYTDAYGLRRRGGDYVVALGTGYADEIGDRFKITLDSGEHFNVVVGDFKADADTDAATHTYTPMQNGNKNVVEFVVDVDALGRTPRKMGDISYCGDDFKGNISKVERIERND